MRLARFVSVWLILLFFGPIVSVTGAVFEGRSTGRFVNPMGPEGMFVEGVDTDSLDWGTLRPGSETPNRFGFIDGTFSGEPGEPIVIGQFDYSNGEAAVGSIPTSVDLELVIELGDGVERRFLFPLEVGATTNNANNQLSSDTVRLGRRAAAELIVVEDQRYVLELEFGKTSEFGFSVGSEFSVFELNSATAELVATIRPAAIVSGRSTGFFDNATGQVNLITAGLGTDTFTWGEPPQGVPPNRLQFKGFDFEGATGQPISIGLFEYFNGSVRTGTAAESLDLFLLMEFPGSAVRTLRFPLSIVSTPNTTDRAASADIVQLVRPVSERKVEWQGQEYEVSLSFGGSGEGGFTEPDRFFVFEDVTETAVLEMTFKGTLPEPERDLALSIKTAVEVEFQTFPGGQYQIQSSEDLATWTDEGEPIVGTGRKHREFYSVPVDSNRAYRVVELGE